MESHILIAVHGRPDLLERTLRSIADAEIPSSLRSVVVVENGSNAGARAVCSSLRSLPIEYHHLEQAGKSRALQWAIDHVIQQGPIIFFDDDVRVAPSTLNAYVRAVELHGRNHIYGGAFGVDYEVHPPEYLLPYLPRSAKGWQPEGATNSLEGSDCFFGCNYCLFAEDIISAGGFRLDFGPGAVKAGTEGNPIGQEWEMQCRLKAAGAIPVYVSDAYVWHYVPAERCSQEWALHRVFRQGLTKGMMSRKRSVALAFRAPRWAWRRLIGQGAMLVKTAVTGPRADFIDYRFKYQYTRGYIAGYRSSLARSLGDKMSCPDDQPAPQLMDETVR